MHSAHRELPRFVCRTLTLSLVWCVVASVGSFSRGQDNNTVDVISTRAVGGVSIDTDGVLSNAQTDDLGMLGKLRTELLEKIPADLEPTVEMLRISLRGIEAELEECAKSDKPIPDTLKYLAGLQSVRYVFVYPEQNDIVLAGPGEGWCVDAKGTVVGATTGRPVMLLDDLVVALRTARAAANGGITCSIDPTSEGLARMKQRLPALTASGNPGTVASGIENALGMQRISVHGVPETSHFARVLVAADYRMKRLAMNLDPSPVRGLPSYLGMVKPSTRAMISPRFWLEPEYESLVRDADGLAFELRGSGVKAMTEEDFIAASGNVQHTGKAGPAAQKWADIMTEKYAELAVADPVFGQLQNCMELAVVSALIVKERLAEKAGHSMPTLLESSNVKPESFPSPKQVESLASVMKKGRKWLIGTSGGVAINSWAIADRVRADDSIGAVRGQASLGDSANWWAN